MQEYNCSKQWLSETIFGTFLWPVEHVRRSSNIAVDTLSNSAESENNKLIDDPDRDVTYHCLREYFSLGNAINKPRRQSHAKVCVNSGQYCKRLLQKHKTVPFTHVNVAALCRSLPNQTFSGQKY